MADNTILDTGSGGDTVRDKDRSGVKTQIVGLDLTPGGGSETLMNGTIPVDDADTQTALASLLTELGQKLEPGDLAALATAAKQDAAKTVFDNILLAVDGLEGKDYATQTTLASVLAAVDGLEGMLDGVETLLAAATPAGNNNIGDVDVATVPTDPFGANADAAVAAGAAGSIQAKLRRATQALEDLKTTIVLGAGTNNIGDVDVLTVPADPFGATADATVAAGATGSISAKLRRATQGLEDLKTLIVLGAGSNAIGKLAANSGVDIGDVDVTSISAGTNAIGNVGVIPRTTGGYSKFHLVSAASTNATNVKASAGQVFGWYIYNSNAAARKVAFHNTAGTPTAGTSVTDALVIPPLSAANVFSETGIAFSTGIAITTVTELTDAGSTGVAASDLVINLYYA